jgi:hypothetical protein
MFQSTNFSRTSGPARRAWRQRLLHAAAGFTIVLLAACTALTTSATRPAAPAPCMDSTYLQLRQQHPDSLSERSWQRLQSLERECANARSMSQTSMSAANHGHGGLWKGIGAGVVMIAMALAVVL